MKPVFIFFIIGFVALVAGIIYLNYYYEKKRKEALRQIALRLGLEYAPEADQMLLSALGGFHLFQLGHANTRKIFNQLRGSSRNADVAIFDYQYVTGHGKNRQTWIQTVICFNTSDLHLPLFCLRPENIWHKMGAWFGRKDINFENHPGFSSKYQLKGDDETAIRRLFSTRILSYYENEKGLCTEGSNSYLLIYRTSTRVKPELINAFMEQGFKILTMFQDSARFIS